MASMVTTATNSADYGYYVVPNNTSVGTMSIDTGSKYSWKFDEDGVIELGDGFRLSVKEFRACIKAMRDIACKEYPEDFI